MWSLRCWNRRQSLCCLYRAVLVSERFVLELEVARQVGARRADLFVFFFLLLFLPMMDVWRTAAVPERLIVSRSLPLIAKTPLSVTSSRKGPSGFVQDYIIGHSRMYITHDSSPHLLSIGI